MGGEEQIRPAKKIIINATLICVSVATLDIKHRFFPWNGPAIVKLPIKSRTHAFQEPALEDLSYME